MKRKIQGSSSSHLTRGEIIDQIEVLRDARMDLNDTFENILFGNNANEDDSDPNEGMYNTMSDEELQSSLNIMRKVSVLEDLEGLETQLADVLDTVSDLQDRYFNNDETFSMLIRCHDGAVKAKQVVSKFLENWS